MSIGFTIIKPPFNSQQVELMKKYQKTSKHPMTCGLHQNTKMIPGKDGWKCPIDNCTYIEAECFEFILYREKQTEENK